MSTYIYVDNSNVWIEGKHVSAVEKGMAANLDVAMKHCICDQYWTYDFGKLLQFTVGDLSKIGRAVLFGSKPPITDTLWDAARSAGFEVKTEDRSYYTNKEKKIDMGIGTTILEDSFIRMTPGSDDVVLVAGDRDYVPVVESLKSRGIEFNVCFWNHASSELKNLANNFYSLNPHLHYLAR